MKKFFTIICLLILVLMASCTTSRHSQKDGIYSLSPNWVKTFTPDTLSVSQLDSVSVADNLPSFTKWRTAAFKDQETGKNSVYFTILDPETNIIYTVKQLSKNEFVLFKKAIQAQ